MIARAKFAPPGFHNSGAIEFDLDEPLDEGVINQGFFSISSLADFMLRQVSIASGESITEIFEERCFSRAATADQRREPLIENYLERSIPGES